MKKYYYLYNSNGKFYQVHACCRVGYANVYLLADRMGECNDSMPVRQFIVAYDWDDDFQSWGHGKYFLVHDNQTEARAEMYARDCFLARVKELCKTI